MKDHLIRRSGDPLYPEIMAKQKGWTWENSAEPGTCNRRIIRTAARAALNLDSSTLMLISLTEWARTELFHEVEKFGIDEVHVSVKLHEDRHRDFFKFWFKYADCRGEIANLFADLVMLTNMLKYKNIPYLIYFHCPLLGAKNLDTIEQGQFAHELNKDPRILNLFNDSLIQHLGPGDWFYDSPNCHLSAAGHKKAAEVLLNLVGEPV